MDNPAFRVREWYEPIARDWLESAAHISGEIRLIADGTQVGLGHQLLIISLAFHRGAIPLAWTWVKSRKGHSSACRQLALLDYFHRLMPKGVAVSLVGDSEFGAIDVQRQLKRWHWQYVLRQKASHQIRMPGQDWQDFGDMVSQPGQSVWLSRGQLTREQGYQPICWPTGRSGGSHGFWPRAWTTGRGPW